MKATVSAARLTRAGRRVLQMRRVTDTVPWSRMALVEARDNGSLRLSVVNADGGAREVVRGAEVKSPGVVAVNVDMLDRLFTVLPLDGEVSVELRDSTLVMASGRVRQRVPTGDPGHFNWPGGRPESWFDVDDRRLQMVIRSVLWATSEDPGRVQSNAVHMTSAASEATNGHVGAQVRPGLVPEGVKLLVPAEAWTRVKTFVEGGKMSMAVEPGRFWLRGDNWVMFQRLLPEMSYYDLSRMAYAPDDDGNHYLTFNGREHAMRVHSVLVNREEILTSCRHVLSGAVTSDERSMGSAVRFLVEDGGVMHATSYYPADIVSRGIDVDEVVRWSPDSVGEDDLSPFSHLSGFCFYSLYMVKALTALAGDVVKMTWAEGTDRIPFPSLQFHGQDGAVALVSPRRL